MNPAIENRLMEMLTSGDLPELRTLRTQWRSLDVEERQYHSEGFQVSLRVPDACPRVGDLSTDLSGVSAEVPGGQAGIVLFDLFIRGGAITFLQGSKFEPDKLPDVNTIALEYRTGGERDWDYLRRVFSGGSTDWPPSHIFDNPEHDLGKFEKKFDSVRSSAKEAVEKATRRQVKRDRILGEFRRDLEVAGCRIHVRGLATGGQVKISDFWTARP